jgi:hypothetical protein
MDNSELHAEEILKLEFEYAGKTAEQAQDDRTAIMNLYLLLVGGVGSIAVALPQFAGVSGIALPREAYALLFGLLALIGFFVLLKLVRLRQAWYDSARAMNQIKEFYLARFAGLDKAFRWRAETIPPPGKPWTITFNLALLVAVMDSVALAIAVYLIAPRVPLGEYAVGAFAAIVYFLWQVWFYFFQLPISANARA